MDAEKLADEARNSISNYCIEECHAYCCRKGYLELTRAELVLVSNNHKKILEDRNALDTTQNQTFLLDLSKNNCPSLKDNLCMIHKNDGRPKACKEFPLFIWENKKIHLSERCPAVREGKFYPYVLQFRHNGYSVDEKNPLVLD